MKVICKKFQVNDEIETHDNDHSIIYVLVGYESFDYMKSVDPFIDQKYTIIFSHMGCVCHVNGIITYEQKLQHHRFYGDIQKMVNIFIYFVSTHSYPKAGFFVDAQNGYYLLSLIGKDASDDISSLFTKHFSYITPKLMTELKTYLISNNLIDAIVLKQKGPDLIYIYPIDHCEQQISKFLSERFCPYIYVEEDVVSSDLCFAYKHR